MVNEGGIEGTGGGRSKGDSWEHWNYLITLFPGEEWLVKRVGAYLPGVYEEVVDVVDAYVLTDKVLGHGIPPGLPCTPG